MSKKKNHTTTKTAHAYPEFDVAEDKRTLDEELSDYEAKLNILRIRRLEETIVEQAQQIGELRRQLAAHYEWDRQDEIYRKHGA